MDNKIPHILIVDDDASLLATTSDILKMKGFEPVIAQTGGAALAQLEQHNFDLALVDLRLGDMSGLEVLRAIKSHSPETECVLLTGHATQNSAIEAIQMGVYGYFQKPFDMDQVLLSIQHAVEKHTVAAALRESEDRYRTLVESSPDSICIHCEGKVVYANPAAVKLFHASYQEDVIGMPVIQFVHPDYRKVAMERVQLSYENNLPAALLEEKFITMDGQPIDVEVIGTPIIHEGKPATQLIIRNITERKQAEIEIKERTEELELINALNEAVNHGDSIGKVIEIFSRGLRQISVCKDSTVYLISPDGKHLIMQHLGLSPSLIKKIEQLIGRPIPPLKTPIKEGGYFQHALQSESGVITTDPKVIQNWMLEFTESDSLPAILRKTARKLIPQFYKLLDIHSTLTVPLISEKKVIGLLDVSSSGTLTEKDLSRIQKISGQLTAVILSEQANKALLESEDRYRSIFDGVQDAIFVETKDGRILEANSGACKMYGYSSDEFLKKTVPDLVLEGSSIFPASRIQQNIPLSALETINRRSNGDLFPVEISGGAQTINGEEILLVIVRDITERKQAEEALKNSEEKFRTYIEQSTDGLAIFDEEGLAIEWNPALEQINGIPKSQALGMTLWDIQFMMVPDEDKLAWGLDRLKNSMLEILKNNQSSFFKSPHEVAIQKISGEKKYIQQISFPIKTDKGYRIGAIIRDVTERKQAEEAIRQRIKEMELLYESGLAFSQLLNPKEIAQKIIELLGEKLDWHHTAIRTVNMQDESLELLAFDQPGLESKEVEVHLRKFITKLGEGLSGWALQQSKVVRAGDVHSDQHYVESYPEINSGLYVPLKSGERMLGVISIESEQSNAFSEADEKLIATLASQAAIAFENARLYEEALHYTEELERHVQERTAEIESTRQRLELAVETAGIGIWELDIKQNNDYWDDKLFTLYGLSKVSALPSLKTWHNAIHPDDLVQQLKLMDEALQHNQPYNAEFRVVWPDASIHYIKSSGIVIRDEAGLPERMIGANQDITIHKQAEETLSLANAEMERGMRMKNEFLANMSHELRTPLNAILGISESLEEQISGKLNEKQLKYVRIINESGRHLLELINDVLDLSKVEAGKLELDIQSISVEKFCVSTLRLVRELAQKKLLNISFKMDEKVKVILGDERRLKQSLVNLLGNAVKFTPEGKKIGLEVNGNAETNEVTFTVWDEGIGIDQENIQYLFKPFVQLNTGLSREYAGTGLGLALVAQMVRLHGGRIDLTSELKMGSRFVVTLPWMPAQQRIQLQTKPLGSVDNSKFPVTQVETSNKKHTGKILIVEDTEVVAQLVTEYLQHVGYETLLANNGREAILLARQERPQVILMDVMMPVMNGLDATRLIRTDAILRDVPIIGLTALAMPNDREQCLAAGMNDYLSKPVQMQELVKLIERYLNQTS